jgi:integrase
VIVRTKNESEHVIYLPHQAVSMLRSLNPDGKAFGLVFPARQRDGRQSPIGGWDRFTKLVFAASQTSGWVRHDMRRTAATIMGNLGTEPHVVEAALNHAVIYTNLAGIYNQARYRSEVGIALQALADRLDAIVAGTTKPLTGRRQKEVVDA